jgi:predicted nucleic acid-binding protein
MSKALVPDASVAVKWLLQENGSEAAAALLRLDASLCGPALLRVEVRAAIVRAFRVGAISEPDARERLADSAKILSQSRVRFIPDAALLVEASEIAIVLKHNLQECLYVACAIRAGGDLVTADQTFLARAAPHYPFVRAL